MPRRSAARRRWPWRTALVVLVLVIAGFLGYQYWASDLIAAGVAEKTTAELRARWTIEPRPGRPGTPEHVDEGQPFALLRVPRFGDAFVWPITAGVSSVGSGLAWYETSSWPGQPGNVAIAGQRLTHGAPFARLLDLDVGDSVVIETRDTLYTYTLVSAPRDLTVVRDAAWVLDPVPGKPDEVPWQSVLTLTPAQDLAPTNDRSVGFGVLTHKETKP